MIVLIVASVPAVPQAQTREATLAVLNKLAATERQAKLVEGAKKENGLVWYSSTTAEDALAMIKKFNEQYPAIKINHFRAPSEKLLERIFAEARANAFKADLVALPELELNLMSRRKLLARFDAAEGKIYPPESKDPAGYWTGLYTSAWVPAHNTKLVAKDGAPKTYKDLLNPKWKGQIAMDLEPYNWYVVSLRYLEQRDGKEAAADYMKKLAAQQIQWRKGHSLIGQLMSAGEFPLVLNTYIHNAEDAKRKGAPVDWVAQEPVFTKFQPIGVAAKAPHPNAAKLFVDFMLSEEGQKIIASFGRVPTRRAVPTNVANLEKLNFVVDDIGAGDDYNKNYEQFRNIFAGPKQQ
jgi:iron(III) transport system substrate-binding protein